MTDHYPGYIPDDSVLPCGCIIRCEILDGEKTVIYIPCRLTCRHYLDMIGLAMQEGVPVTKKYAP